MRSAPAQRPGAPYFPRQFGLAPSPRPCIWASLSCILLHGPTPNLCPTISCLALTTLIDCARCLCFSRSRVAPPKLASHTRAKLASHRTDSDDTSDNSNWDDEIKTPCHGSPAMGPRGSGGLPTTIGASEAATTSGVASGADQGQANHWEHFDD